MRAREIGCVLSLKEFWGVFAQVGRANDLYLFCCGAGHKVAPQGRYVAFLSTTVEGAAEGESAQAIASRELSAGLMMLAGATRIFYDVYDLMTPSKDGTSEKAGP